MGRRRRARVCGVHFDLMDEGEVVQRITSALAEGMGGWITIPCLEAIARAGGDSEVRASLAKADGVLPSGRILRVASLIAGIPLPERSGTQLIWSMSTMFRSATRGVYLLGGQPEDSGVREGAHQAASVLSFACPGVTIAGHASPRLGDPGEERELAAIRDEIVEAAPDVVLVGLDIARQAWFATRLREDLPGAWTIGWLSAIDMLTGQACRPTIARRRATVRPALRLWALAARERLSGQASDLAGIDPPVFREEGQDHPSGLPDR